MKIRPLPRPLRGVLSLFLPADWRDDIVRDLEEAWSHRRASAGRSRAFAWLTAQVVSFSIRFLPDRVRDGVPAGWSSTDLRLAWRATVRAPLVTGLALVSLSVGMGATMLGFSLTEGLAFSWFPFEGGDRIVLIQDYNRTTRTAFLMTPREFLRRRATLESYEYLAAWTQRSVVVGGEEFEPRVERVLFVSEGFLDMASTPPLLGRLPAHDDTRPGAEPTVVLPHAAWVRLTGADPDILGRRLRIGGVARTVIGVMPPDFGFPYRDDIWIPFDVSAWDGNVSVLGKLQPGVGRDVARAEMAARAHVDPTQAREGDEVTHLVVDMSRPPMVDDRQVILLVVPVAILVVLLLLMATNVANLILARNAARADELAVRTALGGSRVRVVGQLALEVALLVALSAVAGTALSRVGVALVETHARDLPIWADFSLGPAAVLFAVGLAAAVTALAGVLPAARATRHSPSAALKDGARGSGVRFGRLTGALVTAQVALSVGFLSAAALLGQSLLTYGFDRYGLPADETLVTQLYFGWPRQASPGGGLDPAARAAVADSFLAEVERKQAVIREGALAIPGVRSAAFGDRFPGNESGQEMVEIEESTQPISLVEVVRAGRGYFELLGADMAAGRGFSVPELGEGRPVAVVNEPFVRDRLSGANPLGRRIRFHRSDAGAGEGTWVTIVGVVPDLGMNPGNPSNAATVYLPLPPSTFVRLALRGGPNPSAWSPTVAELVRETDPAIHLQGARTLASQLREPVTIFRTLGTGFLVLGILALLLSSASLHAITACHVTGRTREMGIRQALGAGTGDIVGQVLRRSAFHMGAGSLLGTLLALGLLQVGSLFPWEVRQANPWAALAVAGLLALSLVTALARPLQRALSIRPAEAMRSE